MKLMIFLAIGIVGSLGAWLGALLDNGNWFGLWSLLLGTIGSFIGVWVGYKAGQYLGG